MRNPLCTSFPIFSEKGYTYERYARTRIGGKGAISFFGSYAGVLFGRTFRHVYVRNYLFTGIPYVVLGMGADALMQKKGDTVRRLRPLIGAGVLLFSVTSVIEKRLLSSTLPLDREHFLSSILLSLCLFLFFVSKKEETRCPAGRLAAKIGRSYSTFIYVMHPIVRYAVLVILTHLSLGRVFDAAGAPIVFVCTAIGAALYALLVRALKKRFGNRRQLPDEKDT